MADDVKPETLQTDIPGYTHQQILRGHYGDHALHLPLLARPDRHHPCRPRHGGRPERLRPPRLDRHRLSPDLDRGHAHHRQTLRHLGPPRAPRPEPDPFHHRKPCLRFRPIAAAADRLPRHPGPRRRRAHVDGPSRHRRRRRPPRARSLSGLHGVHVGYLVHRRPHRRRMGHRHALLALDLLGQPPDRPRRPVSVQPRPQDDPRPEARGPDRLSRLRPPGRQRYRVAPDAELGRGRTALVVHPGRGTRPGRHRSARLRSSGRSAAPPTRCSRRACFPTAPSSAAC